MNSIRLASLDNKKQTIVTVGNVKIGEDFAVIVDQALSPDVISRMTQKIFSLHAFMEDMEGRAERSKQIEQKENVFDRIQNITRKKGKAHENLYTRSRPHGSLAR